jgi:hypothetical protein
MADPVSRLQLAQQEIDRCFGSGFARDHPELVAVVVSTAASDFAALTLAHAIKDVAVALLEDGPRENGPGIARASLWSPR